MSRSLNPTPQFFDNAGEPLAFGKMYYYESGTNDDKSTYADVNESTLNTNPVILTGDGRLPNVFFTGSAKMILTDADDVQYWERDPVTSTESSSFGDQWDAVSIYDKNDVVSIGTILYVSLIDSNQNKNPASINTAWTQFDLLKRWNVNESYKVRDPVIGTDGAIYTSIISSNLGNDPVGGGGVNWSAVGGGTDAGVFADWDPSISYNVGGNNLITGSDGFYYISLLAFNLNNDPISSPTYWTRINFVKIWNTNETYGIDDLVTGSDNQVYQAVISSTAIDPISDDGTRWLPRHNIFDNLTISGNTISSTDTDGDIVLDPNGTGEVDVSTSKVVNVTEGTASSDAATVSQLIPPTTKMLFPQASAPLGWAGIDTYGDRALHLVSESGGTGGDAGGSHTFSTVFSATRPTDSVSAGAITVTVAGHAVTTPEMPLHGHQTYVSTKAGGGSNTTGGIMLDDGGPTANYGAFTGTASAAAGRQVGGEGGGDPHGHTGSTASQGSHSHTSDLAVKYVNIIQCSKDAY
jgi:hypothetical protein